MSDLNAYELTNFQIPGFERATQQRRHGIAYEMGLGKTVVGTRALFETIISSPTPIRRVLILAPKNAIRVWEDHIDEWFGVLETRLGKTVQWAIWRWRKKYGNATKRRKLWTSYFPDTVNIYITTVAGFIQDLAYFEQVYDVIIVDEAKRIRNYKREGFKALRKVVLLNPKGFFWPMTGTPGKEPKDFWTMLHLMDPKYHSSYWRFVNAFYWTQKGYFGGLEILGLKNDDEWRRLLRTKFSIVTKEMVGRQPIRRQRLYVTLDDVQQDIYDQLTTEMMAIHDDKLIMAQNSLVLSTKLRQLLICPKILDPGIASYGSALEDLVDTLEETDPHTVIFTPFTSAFAHFQARLNTAGHKDVFFLSGEENLTPDEIQDRIMDYRRARGIMLCTVAFAQAFSLEPADKAFFIGYSLDPEENAQAEARLDRLTTTYPVNAYYYTYENTYDDQLMEIVNWKQKKIHATIPLHLVGAKFDQ